MSDKEYILFCDESEKDGRYYSNFYGGVMVGSSHYDRIVARLEETKRELNLHGEIKWGKVSEPYLEKYRIIMDRFFEEVAAGHLRVRIMFRHNADEPTNLTQEQVDGVYFRLYYQFIKHAFGLLDAPASGVPIPLRLYFDEFPATREAAAQFKGFLLGLNAPVRRAGFVIVAENIAEVQSHDHVLSQCLDIILGAVAFRLNDKHLDKPAGQRNRGKRTVAKEILYKAMLKKIQGIRPHFNVGTSTGMDGGPGDKWTSPYRHWKFVPKNAAYNPERTKRGQEKGPTKPT